MIEITDTEGLRAASEKIKEKLIAKFQNAKISIKQGLTMVGIQVKADATYLAPVDLGNLRRSIYYSVEGSEYVEIGSPVEYAAFQEFGTSKMEAQPFLTPAVNQNREFIKTVLKGEIKEGLNDD